MAKELENKEFDLETTIAIIVVVAVFLGTIGVTLF